MNKIAHGIIFALFAFACWFVWGFLRLSGGVHLAGRSPPAYTRLCLGLAPNVLTTLVIAAGLYCLWVWVRKGESRPPWVAFLATTTGTLVLVLVLVMVAAYLPLLDTLNQLGGK
jgi:hypothetical protein